jgi:hypothetical protein
MGGGNTSGEEMKITGVSFTVSAVGRGRIAQKKKKKTGNKNSKKDRQGFFILMLLFRRNKETKKAAAEAARDVGEMGDIACAAKGFKQLVAYVQR